MQMLKLASNSEFRESAKRVGEELEKAGVDFKSKVNASSCVFCDMCSNGWSAGTDAGDDGAHEAQRVEIESRDSK